MISDGVRFSINFLPFSFIQISTLIWNAKIVFLSRLSRVCSLEAFLICWTENWTWGVRIHLDKRAWEASFSQLASLYHSVSNLQYTFHTLWNPSHYTISRNRKISKNHKNTILGGCWGHWDCRDSKAWKINTEDFRVIHVIKFSFIWMFWKERVLGRITKYHAKF